MNKIILIVLILLITNACSKEKITTLTLNNKKVYSVRYNEDWKIDSEYKNQGEPNILRSFQHTKLLGRINIVSTDKENCSHKNQEIKELKNDYSVDEGPEFDLSFKRDSIKINNKTYERWINTRVIRYIDIFVNIDNEKCILFSYMSNMGDMKQEYVEDSFYKIIGTFKKNK